MDKMEPLSLDYFVGGVPTAEFFRITVDEVRDLSSKNPENEHGINRIQELCFIGLLSYFEAFCKDQFAAIINIEPSLIPNLRVANIDTEIDAQDVILYERGIGHQLGFLLAAKYDFGSARSINALFHALLRITPFGKQDARKYANLQRDRNLLVHHGGVMTLKYVKQTGRDVTPENAFYNSVVVHEGEVAAAADFLIRTALKIAQGSHNTLVQYLREEGKEYDGERAKALEFLRL